ncbi:MAG: hypothetical protein K9N55_13355 [Phycisphaerae bacterium]|nr:hypothetical protein [Phycisphaerae bacterium]
MPCVCSLAALVVAFQYPITQKIHSAIRSQIDNRLSGRPMLDPLDPDAALSD